MSVGPDLTAVVNLHREGRVLLPTLDSMWACLRRAGEAGWSHEAILVLDRADEETSSLAEEASAGRARLLRVDLGDLGLARNAGVAAAAGRYLAFLDGDDLWGEEWLSRCLAVASGMDDELFVIHPRSNLYFGEDQEPYLFIHPDMREDRLDLVELVVENHWTALSFAPTSLYRRFPYRQNHHRDGYGYEDWVWNVETVLGGVRHIVAEGAIHFVRRKGLGESLLSASNRLGVIPRFSELPGLAERLIAEGGRSAHGRSVWSV